MFGMLRDWRLESGLWWSLRQAGALVDRLLCALAPRLSHAYNGGRSALYRAGGGGFA